MLFRRVIGFICALLIAPLPAQAEQGNRSPSELINASTTFRTLSLSKKLIAYGRSNHDALALILAADMRQKLALKPVQRTLLDQDGNAAKTERNDRSLVSEILKYAEKFAAGNEALLELIKDVKFNTSKGKRDGPAYTIATVKPGGATQYKDFQFDINKYAEIYVEGSGETNLDLYVYDANGKLICSDTDKSDINYCGWTPDSSGLYKITIRNRGKLPSQYFLITN